MPRANVLDDPPLSFRAFYSKEGSAANGSTTSQLMKKGTGAWRADRRMTLSNVPPSSLLPVEDVGIPQLNLECTKIRNFRLDQGQ